jgi:hypothetical protein
LSRLRELISGHPCASSAGLLDLDDLIRIQENDLAGAVIDVRAMINAGRSLAEDPSLAVQAGRANVAIAAVATLERILAQGQLAAPVLLELQALMEDEAKHPLALVALRGDRAAEDALMERVRNQRIGVPALFDGGAPPAFLYSWRTLRENQARLLEENTRLAELARRPEPELAQALLAVEHEYYDRWNDANWLTRFYAFPFHSLYSLTVHAAGWQARHRACLDLGIVGLASERFRLDHGRWPQSAGELVPSYLTGIPYDPYGKGPIQWKLSGTGLSIYSVCPNEIDDGGTWVRGNPHALTKDMGFRLDPPVDRPLFGGSK